MPSILERGQSLLNAKLKSAAAETVRVIRSSSVLTDAWRATPSRTLSEVFVDGETAVVGDRHDWSGDPADWRLDGAPTKPQRGDVIEWDRAGYTLVYEVLPADGEDVWSPRGSFDNRIRVHAKVIERRPMPA